jgi:citrate lyase subunit beta/citryl-CoA lyase
MLDIEMGIRISAASPEADLSAAVSPGVTSVTIPRVESAEQIELADAHITRLERLRGMRPRTVQIRPVIESPRGVTLAVEIASSSPRVYVLEVGPSITLELGDDALGYARFECELHARALGLTVRDPFASHD